MSLRELAREMAAVAFEVADDIPVQCIYTHSDPNPHYNVATGEVHPSGTAESIVDFLIGPAEQWGEYDATAVAGHTGMLALTGRVEQFVRRPSNGDTLRIGQDLYEVIAIRPDEADVLYVLLVGRPTGGLNRDVPEHP